MDINEKNWSRLYNIISEYLAQNNDPQTPVVNYLSGSKLKEKLELNIGKNAKSEEQVFEKIEEYLKYSQRTSHPQFNNQLYAGFNEVSFIGEMITHLTNTSMATYEISPVATLMEQEIVRKMNSLVGFGGSEGIMCTGGSNANMLAVHCARAKDDPDAYYNGNKKDYVVYISENAHYSFEKAVNLMGLGLNSLSLVKNDNEGKMIPNDLEDRIKKDIEKGRTPLLVASTAGTTVMGAFDPIDEIDKVAKKFNLWHHADGAWGGSALLSEKFSHLTKGVENIDSFTWDAHKLMGTGVITSFFLSKHEGVLKSSNSTQGGEKYIFHEYENRDFDTGPDSLQCGRKVDILKLWLNWFYLGDDGYAQYMNHLLENKEYFVEKLKNYPEKFKLVHNPEFLNVCFQIIPKDKDTEINTFNFKKRFELVREGMFQTNFSKNPDGLTFFRHIFANNRTQKADIDRFVEKLLSIQ